MYAKTGRENVPVQIEKMMHTHHVMQREQSNGLIGFRSFALMSLVRADLHASVNPDKSTMKIVMAAMSSRSMYVFITIPPFVFQVKTNILIVQALQPSIVLQEKVFYD